jgi:hypothetical protein
MKSLAAVALVLGTVGLGACVPQQYVADVHVDSSGVLVARKCDFAADGTATNFCHDEDVDDGSTAYAGGEDLEDDTITAQDLAAAKPPVEHAPPTARQLAAALAKPGVHKLVEMCKATYAPALATMDARFTVEPTGDIHATTAAGNASFASCAGEALQTANIEPFSGTALHFDQTIDVSR